MQLQYLLVVIVVSDTSDVEVMSSTAIRRVVNNYNIRTEPHFLKTKPNQTHSEPNPEFSKNRTEAEPK